MVQRQIENTWMGKISLLPKILREIMVLGARRLQRLERQLQVPETMEHHKGQMP